MNSPRLLTASRAGFSFAELLIVAVLGVLLVLALQGALLGQRRFFAAQANAATRQQTLLVAQSVLGAVFREADLQLGDAVILDPGRVRARMPLGLAAVCGIDGNGGRVGAIPLQGPWAANPGDSVKVLLATGVAADAIDRIDPPSNRVSCVESGVGMILRLDERVPDVIVTSPARSFRSQIFEAALQGGEYWLFRVDGPQREALLGPLDGPNGFQAWYEDSSGGVAGSLVSAERIAMRVVVRSDPLPGGSVPRRDSLTLRFGGRN